MLEASRSAAARREDGDAVAERVGVDERDGVAEGLHRGSHEHRPENLLGVDRHFRRNVGEKRWANPIAVRVASNLTFAAIKQASGAFRLASGDQIQNALLGGAGDLRSVAGILVVPRAGPNLRQRRFDVRQPLRGFTYKHRGTDRHAALPCRTASRAHQARNRLLLVGVRHHHQMVLRPSERLHPLQVVGGLAVHLLRHGRGTDEADGTHIRMFDQRVRLRLATMHHLHQTVGGPRFRQQFHQTIGRHRILLRRLQHEGIAASDGERKHPQRHHRRKVERRDAAANPNGLHQTVRIDAARNVLYRLAHAQRDDVARLLHHLDATPHLATRILERLAGLAAQAPSKVVLILLEDVLVGEQQPRPLRRRHFAPS